MKTITIRWRFIAAVALLLAALAGCGGGDDEDDGDDTKPTPGVPCDIRPELCR